MAKNLRTKIKESDTMFIHDVNTAVAEQFKKEVGNVTVANNVREIAEQSVSGNTLQPPPSSFPLQ